MTKYEFHEDNMIPTSRDGYLWVFGSNTAGRHGKGAAKVAHINFAAAYGVGKGRTGAAYAIPTKDRALQVLPLPEVKESVHEFLNYARSHPTFKFWVTRIGCGLAGYRDEEIAPMFKGAPSNCNFAIDWKEYL